MDNVNEDIVQNQDKESLESLTEKLAGLNPREHRSEIKNTRAAINKRLRTKAEIQLEVFINDELDKGGALNTNAIKDKARRLGLEYEDIVPHIHLVQQLRRTFKVKG